MGWNSFLSPFLLSLFHFFLKKTSQESCLNRKLFVYYCEQNRRGKKKEVKADCWLPSLAENNLKKRKEGWPQSSITSIFTAQKATRDCVAPSSFVCSSRQMRIKTFQGPSAPAHSLSFSAPSRFTFGTFICVYLTHSSVTGFEEKKKPQQLKIARCKEHKRSGGDLLMKHVIKLSNKDKCGGYVWTVEKTLVCELSDAF